MFNNGNNYNNNNYQGNNRPSLNTNLDAFYGDECMMQLAAWNENLSMTFKPATGYSSDGLTQYASNNEKDKVVRTALTPEKMVILVEACDKVLIPAIHAREPKTVSVFLGSEENKDKCFTLGYDGENTFAKLAWAGEAGAFRGTMTLRFKKTEFYEDYNTVTGDSDVADTVESEFIQFVNYIRLGAQNTGRMLPHAIRYDQLLKNTYANNRNIGNTAAYGGTYPPVPQPQQMQNAFMPQYLPQGSVGEELPFN